MSVGRKRTLWLVGIAVVMLVAVCTITAVELIHQQKRITERKQQLPALFTFNDRSPEVQNGIAFAVAAEYFYAEKHRTPRSFDELRMSGCLDQLVTSGFRDKIPVNPYTGKEVKHIAFGEQVSPGDICFLPARAHSINDFHEHALESGYYIICYGKERTANVYDDPCSSTQQDIYLDSDSDGIADPIAYIAQPSRYEVMYGGWGRRNESLGSVLERLNYNRPLDMPLP